MEALTYRAVRFSLEFFGRFWICSCVGVVLEELAPVLGPPSLLPSHRRGFPDRFWGCSWVGTVLEKLAPVWGLPPLLLSDVQMLICCRPLHLKHLIFEGQFLLRLSFLRHTKHLGYYFTGVRRMTLLAICTRGPRMSRE